MYDLHHSSSKIINVKDAPKIYLEKELNLKYAKKRRSDAKKQKKRGRSIPHGRTSWSWITPSPELSVVVQPAVTIVHHRPCLSLSLSSLFTALYHHPTPSPGYILIYQKCRRRKKHHCGNLKLITRCKHTQIYI